MFRTPVADLPHPHQPDAEPTDAEERLARISRTLAEVGRRNDALREQLKQSSRMIANLVEIAETARDT